jgi:hypothetical protein
MPRSRKPRSTVGQQSSGFVEPALATLIENAPNSERRLRFIFAAVAIIYRAFKIQSTVSLHFRG